MTGRVITAREQLEMLSPWRRVSYTDPMGEQDWNEIYPDLPDTVHRGIGITLPDELHRMVHDPSIPTEQRAQALLRHLGTPEARTSPWGHDWREGLGTSWSGDEGVAEDFGRDMAKQHTDHNDGEARSNDDHTWGTDEDGDPVGKPGTAVMLHAQLPELDEIDDNPNGDGSGQRYTYHGHGEQEIPVHQNTSMHIKGISWRPILPMFHPDYLTDTEEYTHHEFGENNYHLARKLFRVAMPWRIEHPDYQPADVAHNYNPEMGGSQGGGDSRNYLVGPANNVWWHGSASGTIGGGDRNDGLHIGDYQTAAEALNARLGPNPNHPQGRWTGEHSLAETHPHRFDETGDLLPHLLNNDTGLFLHPDGTPMHGSYRPNVSPLAIVGPMGNTTDNAVSDGQAHALMRRQHTRPPKNPKGYYYINAGEGQGVSPETGIVSTVSATVPSVNHVQKLDPAEHEHIAQEAHQNWYNDKHNPDRGSYDMSKTEGMSPMDKYHELQRQTKEQQRKVFEWRNRRRRGY